MARFLARCLDCGLRRQIPQYEFNLAARPRCLACGGPLELSAAAQAKLAKVQTAQRGEETQPKRGKKRPAPEAVRLIPDLPMARHEWPEYPDLYRTLVRTKPDMADRLRADGPTQFYAIHRQGAEARVTTDPNGMGAGVALLLNRIEATLYASGKPYYKVWPSIAAALMHTEVRIEGQHLQLPHQAFEVRLPLEDNPLAPCRAVAVARLQGGRWSEGRDWTLAVTFVDGEADVAGTLTCCAEIPIRAHKLLEDSLAECAIWETNNPGLSRAVVRVCVGVAFFGADRHELVLPDLPRKVIERFQGLRRQPTAEEAQQLLAEAHRDGRRGYKVGSEIDLPRPHYQAAPDNPGDVGTGRGLEHGHIRRGHLRRQPCGPGRQQRKIVFVPPTHVRPDLPLEPQQGYRVRPPTGTAWTPTLTE